MAWDRDSSPAHRRPAPGVVAAGPDMLAVGSQIAFHAPFPNHFSSDSLPTSARIDCSLRDWMTFPVMGDGAEPRSRRNSRGG
jgi:hypothetical protein